VSDIYAWVTVNLCSFQYEPDNKQLLDEVEQNIGICQWRADQLFASTFGIGK